MNLHKVGVSTSRDYAQTHNLAALDGPGPFRPLSPTPGPPAGLPPAGFRRPGSCAPSRHHSAPALRPSNVRMMFVRVCFCRAVMPRSAIAPCSVSNRIGSVGRAGPSVFAGSLKNTVDAYKGWFGAYNFASDPVWCLTWPSAPAGRHMDGYRLGCEALRRDRLPGRKDGTVCSATAVSGGA